MRVCVYVCVCVCVCVCGCRDRHAKNTCKHALRLEVRPPVRRSNFGHRDIPLVSILPFSFIFCSLASLRCDVRVVICLRVMVMLHQLRLIDTCHAAPLPFSDSAVSFVKLRVLAGNIRTASPTV
jgi:hypothetical protein